MRGVADDRKLTRDENVRYALVAMLLSVSFFFLIFLRDRAMWSWRLVAFGVVIGPLAYVLSLFFRVLSHSLANRTKRVIANVLMAPLDFAGGCLALVIVSGLFRLVNAMPFQLDDQENRSIMMVVGLMTAEVGVLFYLFHLVSKRLMRSARRIKDQEFAERELELARAIQQRLLPPERIAGNGYEVRARNLAAHFVAGDFYDVFRLADGTVGVAVADVSGKGMGASLIMATVKAILPLIAEGRRPPATLTELSSRLHGELPPREFIALAYAQYDPATGELELANAGLPDPYLLRNGVAAEVLSVPGPRLPLALRRRLSYESLVITLQPADAILLLTDGLPEATTASATSSDEQLGYEALLQLINEIPAAAHDVLDSLFEAVRRRSTGKLDDDWTALILRASRERPAEPADDDPRISRRRIPTGRHAFAERKFSDSRRTPVSE